MFIKRLYLRLLPVAFLFFMISFTQANAQVSVQGAITDSLLQPIPFAPVALLKAIDSIVVKSVICNENGMYRFEEIFPGNYMIKSVGAGYKDAYSIPFNLDSSSYIAPNVVLLSTGIDLKEISINAFRKMIELKDGMMVVNVEESPIAVGNSVFELLKKIPGVYVDNQNSISLNGKSNVKISIDGRVQQLAGSQLVALLTSMSAENVSKIEIMTNPPPKYDASGSGGVINIVTKKVKVVGFSGNVQAGLSKGVTYRGNCDGGLNYKGRRFALFSNLGYANRVFYDEYLFDRQTSVNNNITYLNEKGERYNTQESLKYLLGGDFYLTEKTTIGFSVADNRASAPFSETGVNKVNGYNNFGFDHTDFYSDTKDNWSNPNLNLNFEHVFDTSGTIMSFAADYSNLFGVREATSRNYFLDSAEMQTLPSNIYRSTHKPDIKIGTLKLDFNKAINKSISMETGAKYTWVDNLNNYVFEKQDNLTQAFIYDSAYSNIYKYKEVIWAGYVNLKKQFKRSELSIGSRLENTNVKGYNETSGFTFYRDYFNVFPNIKFNYSKSEKHSFAISASRRIDRPSYYMLNPYKSYQDQYSSTIGNPYLTPQYSYNVELNHVFKKALYSTFTYSYVNNFMLSYDYQNDTTKETTSTIKNIRSSNYYAYSLFFQKTLFSWWDLTLSGSAYYQNFIGELNGLAINRGAPAFYAYANNDFALPKNFKISISGQYVSGSVFGVATVKSKWSVDVAIKKSFFNDNFIIQFLFVDLFYSDVFSMTSQFKNQDYIFTDKTDTRRLRVTLAYKFGKMRVEKRELKSNDQETGRFEKKLKE